MKIIKYMAIVAMLMASVSASAQHVHSRHLHHAHPVRVVKVVTRPVVVPCTTNKLTKGDRLEMALAYLMNSKYLTIKQYHKMTGLNSEVAEAELDSFAADAAVRIALVVDGRKKMYTMS